MCTDQKKELTGVETTVENPSPPETRPTEEKKEYGNFAFISYSHRDKRLAKWLQRKLEAYRFPSTIRKENKSLPRKISPVFRDETDLYGTELMPSIFQQLDESQFLIVVCSPNSAQSVYVNQEVAYFNSLGRHNRIIPFIIKGSPDATSGAECCYCPALLDPKTNSLLAINANELSRWNALIKLIATMMDLRPDSLIHREKVRRRKRLIASLVAIMVLIAAVAVSFKIIMGPERSAALAKESTAALNRGSVFEAIDKGKESVKNLLRAQEGDDGVVALRSALAEQEFKNSDPLPHEAFRVDTLAADGYCFWIGNAKDNSRFYLYDWDYVYVHDNETGALIEQFQMEPDSEKAAELAKGFGWPFTSEETFSSNFGSNFWQKKQQNKQKHKLIFDENDLTVSDGTEKHTYKNVTEKDFSYCFNADETVFAYYSNNYLHVVDFSTGYSRMWRRQQDQSCELSISPKGRYLIVMDSAGFQIYDCFSYDTPVSYEYVDLFTDVEYGLHEVVLTDTFDSFFYVSGPYSFIKFDFQDEKMPEKVDRAFISNPSSGFAKGIQISPDQKIACVSGSRLMTGDDFYKDITFFKNDPNDLKTLLWLYSDNQYTFTDFSIAFDEAMTIAAVGNGNLYDIRNEKIIYSREADFTAVGMNRNGTQAAAMADNGDVILFDINGEQVAEQVLFNFNDVKKEEDDVQLHFFGIGEKYLSITTEYNLYYCDLTDKKVVTKEDLFLECTEFPSCLYEKDGLLFFVYAEDGGLFVFDPKTQKELELKTQADDDLHEIGELWPVYYTDKTHLLCGTKYIGQQAHNNSYTVYENVNHRFVKLHSFRCSSEAVISFSSDGQYLIINTPLGNRCNATVLDAKTGAKLLELPGRRVSIIGNTIYDVSAASAPACLPTANLYSMDELRKIAKKMNR